MDNNISFGSEAQDLEDVVKQILEIDAKSRALTRQANETRLHAEKNIDIQKDELRQEYLERAKRRVVVVKEEEERLAQEALNHSDEFTEKNLGKLDAFAEDKKIRWINEIYNNIIK